MSEHQSSYRQIFKATSIFGGVQVFNIIIGIIKSKVAAIYLGAEGVGIVGLFNSTIDMIRCFTGLGINTSAVREISEATNTSNGTSFLNRTIINVTRWYWLTAILGLIVVIALSPMLSQWTFNSYDYTWSYALLSLMIFFMTLTAGQLAVMQGLRQIMYIAKASLYGNLVGLFFLVPLYYYFQLAGIVPFLVISSAIAFIFSMYFRHKIAVEYVDVSYKQSFFEGLRMAKIGFVLTLSTSLAFTIGYLLRLYIKDTGSLSDLGYFTAAFAVSEGYLSIVFTAIVSDFYPRLSAINKDNRAMQSIINQQGEMLILIVSPLLVLMILTSPRILKILYSPEFIAAAQLLQWYMLGMYVKATAVPLAYSMLSKGDMKIYITKDIVIQIVSISISILCYTYFGLAGIGIGYLLGHIFNLIFVGIINYVKYGIVLKLAYFKLFIPQLLIGGVLFIITCVSNSSIVTYSSGIILLILSAIVSLKGLHSRIDLKLVITKLKSKIFKK